MSFTLIIDIRGLCLFAPHGDAMHVLLPDEAAGEHGHHHPPHHARFIFDAQYDAEAAARGVATHDSRIWKRLAHKAFIPEVVPGSAAQHAL